ncbi:MAG: hypothetical protein JO248_03835 [Acidimicrobiia bacterium]|nr:hypothetical protein [Acidimicrobiia bacterium]MBV8983555.1 hypothetical protein [Acidimicrobiia bacterium]
MDLGKLLRDAKRKGGVNINVAHKKNIKVARNVVKGNSSAVASARQETEINQTPARRRDDDSRRDR